MTYWNPVERYGVERFAADLASAGGAGLITPDLTPDAAAEWIAAADAHDLDKVFLVAPSSTDERIAMTTAACRGFVYATAVMGVTGARDHHQRPGRPARRAPRPSPRGTDLPVGVGLGVCNGDQAAEVASYADGVIVGSAFVRALLDHPDDRPAGLRGADGAHRGPRRRGTAWLGGRRAALARRCWSPLVLRSRAAAAARYGGSSSDDDGLHGAARSTRRSRVAGTPLTDTDGAAVRAGRDTDKPLTLVFFGYTHCPDICQDRDGQPRLGDDPARRRATATQVDVVFVTTDPARDTEPVLRALPRPLRPALHRPHRRPATTSSRVGQADGRRHRPGREAAHRRLRRHPRHPRSPRSTPTTGRRSTGPGAPPPPSSPPTSHDRDPDEKS